MYVLYVLKLVRYSVYMIRYIQHTLLFCFCANIILYCEVHTSWNFDSAPLCVCVNSELNVHYWLNLCPGPNLLVMKNLVGQFLLSQLKETQNTKRQSRLCGKKLIYENTKLKKISKLLSMWTWYKIE